VCGMHTKSLTRDKKLSKTLFVFRILKLSRQNVFAVGASIS